MCIDCFQEGLYPDALFFAKSTHPQLVQTGCMAGMINKEMVFASSFVEIPEPLVLAIWEGTDPNHKTPSFKRQFCLGSPAARSGAGEKRAEVAKGIGARAWGTRFLAASARPLPTAMSWGTLCTPIQFPDTTLTNWSAESCLLLCHSPTSTKQPTQERTSP